MIPKFNVYGLLQPYYANEATFEIDPHLLVSLEFSYASLMLHLFLLLHLMLGSGLHLSDPCCLGTHLLILKEKLRIEIPTHANTMFTILEMIAKFLHWFGEVTFSPLDIFGFPQV